MDISFYGGEGLPQPKLIETLFKCDIKGPKRAQCTLALGNKFVHNINEIEFVCLFYLSSKHVVNMTQITRMSVSILIISV